MSEEIADLAELDRIEDVPHPRETVRLFGHAAAEAEFLDTFASGRMHHGWLIAGPRGIGKATLAWRIARFLLAQPLPEADAGLFGAPPSPESLDVPADHPVARRISVLSEPRLALIRRSWDTERKPYRPKSVITVSETRRLHGFFGMSAADGGRRVVIVDAADEMNANAANALLKLLEEPPALATLLLVAHRPSALLPTIRSRCRLLRLGPLGADDLAAALDQAGLHADAAPQALAELSGGSVGEALRLARHEGLAGYAALVGLMADLPRLDRARVVALADGAAGRGGDADARLDVTLRLFDLFLARAARAAVTGSPPQEAAPGEAALLARLGTGPAAGRLWASLHQDLGARARHGRAVNLDPGALLLDMVLRIEQAARGLAA